VCQWRAKNFFSVPRAYRALPLKLPWVPYSDRYLPRTRVHAQASAVGNPNDFRIRVRLTSRGFYDEIAFLHGFFPQNC